MKKSVINIISIIILLSAIAMLAAITVPLVSHYKNPAELKAYIEVLGARGLLMMFFVQVSQIIVALIPGEIIEFVAGALYGCIGGFIFCMLGIIVGQIIIFQAVRLLGHKFVEKVAGSKLMNRFKFLQDEKKLKSIIFFLFFIPGTPKDMLTYIVPLTKISLHDFIILTAVARIPSVFSSVFAGSAFSENNLLVLFITYTVIIVFTLAGLMIYKFVYLKHKALNNSSKSSDAMPASDRDKMLINK